MSRKIKVAIVGCGRISKNHLLAIFENSTVSELTAICDNQHKRIEQFKEKFSELKEKYNYFPNDPKVFNDYDELLNSVKNKLLEVDLIVLATPSGFHSIQCIKAAKLGLNICTEKPMATSLEDGKKMLDICNKCGVKLFVIKQNRFNKTLIKLKNKIEKGSFGKIALITSNVFWQRPQSYYDQDKWRGTLDLDGGALMNQASHYIDLLIWLNGPVQRVSASISTIARKIEAEDTAVLNLNFKNGSLGSMAVTMLAYPKNIEGSITLLGEKGSAKIGGPALNKIELWEFENDDLENQSHKDSDYQIKNVYGLGHNAYYKNMIEAIKGNEKASCDGEQGFRSLELLIAAYRSSKNKESISLPLE